MKRLSDAKKLPRLVFALQKPANPNKKGTRSPLISNDLMPVRFLEPRAAAVLGGREDYRLGITVGDVPLAVVELLEIHLDVPVLAVVVVRADPADGGAIVVSYERRIRSRPCAEKCCFGGV